MDCVKSVYIRHAMAASLSQKPLQRRLTKSGTVVDVANFWPTQVSKLTKLPAISAQASKERLNKSSTVESKFGRTSVALIG